MKIKVLMVMPGKEVQIIKIPASMKFIRSFIGKDLFKIELDKNIMLIASKNANNDEFNRLVFDNIILGTFLVVCIKNNRIVSMKKKDLRRYFNIFKLRKHKKKIDIYKTEYLEEYYSNQRKIKQKNAIENRENLFKVA